MILLLLYTFISFLTDQVIKFFVITTMTRNTSVTVIPHFFSITYVENEGSAFSLFPGFRYLFIIIALLTLVAIYFLFIHKKVLSRLDAGILGFLIGGILGNVFDRIMHGVVIDYLDFHLGNFSFPVFNIADICIVVSVLLLVIVVLKGNKKPHEKG